MTKRQDQKVSESARAFRLNRFNSSISFLALCVSCGGLWWQIHQTQSQKKSYDGQLASINTSIRLLTATVAPQLQKAIDDSLTSVLANPTDPAREFQSVESKTMSLRQLGAKLPPNQLERSSFQLRKALSLYPKTVSAWGAAAQMVSYRSNLEVDLPHRPDCFSSQGKGERNLSIIEYHDCILNLDDVERYNELNTFRVHEPDSNVTTLTGVLASIIKLNNGTVHYSGGKIIGMGTLICAHCAFDFTSPNELPPPSGRALSQQLLTADLSNVSLNLSAL